MRFVRQMRLGQAEVLGMQVRLRKVGEVDGGNRGWRGRWFFINDI